MPQLKVLYRYLADHLLNTLHVFRNVVSTRLSYQFQRLSPIHMHEAGDHECC